jgi:carbon storage regulator CsrA
LLVLTRKAQEKIEIVVPPGDEIQVIKVVVADVMQNRVKIGIIARQDVQIRRTDARSRTDKRDSREAPSSI